MSIPAGRSGSRLSGSLAVLALVVALAALATAGLAYQRAGSDVRNVASGPSGNAPDVPPATGTTDGPATSDGDDATASTSDDTVSSGTGSSGSETPPLPTGTATYTTSYSDETVILKPFRGSVRKLDLDRPSVNSDDARTDVRYDISGIGAKPQLTFTSESVATAKSSNTTPAECARAIQLSPIDTQVDLSQDLVLCAVTNGVGATGEPGRAKMVRIVVRSVGDDGAVALGLTAWEIPH